MRKGRLAVFFLAAVALLSLPAPVCAKGWETLKTEATGGKRIATDTDIEIRASRGVIYINSNKNINIKIFTILGSQIANDTLGAGSYQYIVPTHGVYIIKAGDLTCKVAL